MKKRMYEVPVYRVDIVKEPGALKGPVTDEPFKAARIAREFIGKSAKEHFIMMALDSRNNIIGVNLVSVGTLSASLVHPREVFQPAILLSAAAIIVSHNHPSGDATPSPEDKNATRRLKEAGELLGIPLLDHVVINDSDGHFSFREKGLLS